MRKDHGFIRGECWDSVGDELFTSSFSTKSFSFYRWLYLPPGGDVFLLQSKDLPLENGEVGRYLSDVSDCVGVSKPAYARVSPSTPLLQFDHAVIASPKYFSWEKEFGKDASRVYTVLPCMSWEFDEHKMEVGHFDYYVHKIISPHDYVRTPDPICYLKEEGEWRLIRISSLVDVIDQLCINGAILLRLHSSKEVKVTRTTDGACLSSGGHDETLNEIGLVDTREALVRHSLKDG